jgi:hypothetical protein
LSTVTSSKSVIKPGKKAPSSQPETHKRRNEEPDDESYDESHESESDAEEQPVNPKPAAKQTVQHRTGRASSKASQANKMEIDAEQAQTLAVTTKKRTKQKMTLKGNDGTAQATPKTGQEDGDMDMDIDEAHAAATKELVRKDKNRTSATCATPQPTREKKRKPKPKQAGIDQDNGEALQRTQDDVVHAEEAGEDHETPKKRTKKRCKKRVNAPETRQGQDDEEALERAVAQKFCCTQDAVVPFSRNLQWKEEVRLLNERISTDESLADPTATIERERKYITDRANKSAEELRRNEEELQRLQDELTTLESLHQLFGVHGPSLSDALPQIRAELESTYREFAPGVNANLLNIIDQRLDVPIDAQSNASDSDALEKGRGLFRAHHQIGLLEGVHRTVGSARMTDENPYLALDFLRLLTVRVAIRSCCVRS